MFDLVFSGDTSQLVYDEQNLLHITLDPIDFKSGTDAYYWAHKRMRWLRSTIVFSNYHVQKVL